MPSRTEGLPEIYYRREGDRPDRFRYYLPDGSRLRDRAELERIARLAVPPGYAEVYVAPDPEAELQAFGRDSAGRLQYRYHPQFLQASAEGKWGRLTRFADSLGRMRQESGADLRREGLEPRRVMALMTRLLYLARFRVGSDAYAEAHKTYGLTTLRHSHARVEGDAVAFRFKGKHGIWQHKLTTDRTVVENVAALRALPGPWLFQALTEAGRARVRAHDLNRYIREVMGPFTAKDFRTWGGTLLAAEFLAETGPPQSDRQARATLVDCVKHVAADLGNTPAVVRAHYVCPTVFDHYLGGRVLDDFEPRASRRKASGGATLTRSELALKRLLQSQPKAD